MKKHLFVASLSILSVALTFGVISNQDKISSSFASNSYTCSLPSGYREIRDVCAYALNNNEKANPYKFRGTVTRVKGNYAYIQRVNQSNGELDSIRINDANNYNSLHAGVVVDIEGETLYCSNNVPSITIGSGSLDIAFEENTSGYDPLVYSPSEYMEDAFSRDTYNYSHFVEVDDVQVKFEISKTASSGSDVISCTFVSSNNSNLYFPASIYTGSTSNTNNIISLLNNYYLQENILDLQGILSFDNGNDCLRIVDIDDISNAGNYLRNPQQTTILHAWNWSVNNIINELDNIKNAGYKSIQISPMQPQKDYYANSTWSNEWWKLYQPYGFKVSTSSGESIIGTKTQLTNLCTLAKQKGINIIMDVVANHLANNGDGDQNFVFASNVRNYEQTIYNSHLVHSGNYRTDSDNNTEHIVWGCMGMPDLDTSNEYVQNRVIAMLKDYIDCGVTGFRFDAAKHIETPSDGYYASNFWSSVTASINSYANNNYGFTPYIYGEILYSPGTYRSWNWYTPYMSVTDSGQGNAVLGAITSNNVDSLSYTYSTGLDPNKLVLWAESHDTYADNSTSGVSQTNINKAYAIQASRKDASSLYLARPNSSTKMGNIGTTSYKSSLVRACNLFHNKLINSGEYINKNSGYFMNIRKGDEISGALIVNVSGSGSGSINLNIDANYMIPDGNYKELISGATVSVNNGYVNASFTDGVMVLLGDFHDKTTVNVSSEAEIFETSTNVTVTAHNAKSSYYQINGGSKNYFVNASTFSIGNGLSEGDIVIKVTALDMNDNEVTKSITITRGDIGYRLYINDVKQNVTIVDASEDDKYGDTWIEQYKITLSVNAGDELSFKYNSHSISVSPSGGDNNVDENLTVLSTGNNIDLYLKKYADGSYNIWLNGYIEPGFGILLNENTIRGELLEDLDASGRTQYYIHEQDFEAGDTFSLYNFSSKDSWVIDIDSYSFGGQAASYIQKNANNYTVLQDFTADLYIKLKFEDDQLYIGLISQEPTPEPTPTPTILETVTITFKVTKNVGSGNAVYIVGDFCSWSASNINAIRMSWTSGNVWTVPVELAINTTWEYKFVIASYDNPGNQTWEGGGNRSLTATATTTLNLTWQN